MEHVNNFMVDDMYILIAWGKEHAIDEVCWCRMWIGLDGWVYVLDKWQNGGTMKVEIPGHVDIAISRQVLSRSWLLARCMFWVRKKTLVLWKIGDQVRHARMICSCDPPQIMGRVC